MRNSKLANASGQVDRYLNDLNLNALLPKHNMAKASKTLVCYVIHALPDMLPLLNFVDANGLFTKQNLLLILKSSSHNSEITQKLIDDNYQVSKLCKDDFINKPHLIHAELSSYCKKYGFDKIVILDHGGYFAYNLKEGLDDKAFLGVIGHGRVSSGVTETLLNHIDGKILIYDTGPYKLMKAQHSNFDISCSSVEVLIKQSNLIVVGTDTAPIMPEHYSLMRNNTGVVTVTSADDSIGLNMLVSQGYLRKIHQNKHFSSYLNLKGNVIHFVCDGEAPNLAMQMSPKDVSIAMPYVLQLLIGYSIACNQHRLDPYSVENFLMESYLDLHRNLIADSTYSEAA